MKLKTFFTTIIFTALCIVPAFAFSKIEGKVTTTYEDRVIITTEDNGRVSILLEDAAILKSKRLIDAEDIKEGDKLLVIYEERSFAPLIYPQRKIAHTALVRRSDESYANNGNNGNNEAERTVINMLDLLPFYARGTNTHLVGLLETIIDTNYYTGLEVFEDILNF